MCYARSLIILLCCGVVGLLLLAVNTNVVQVALTTSGLSWNVKKGNIGQSAIETHESHSRIDDPVNYSNGSMETNENRFRKDNRTLYMTSAKGGRMGNKMFQYAVLFGVTFNSPVWKPCIRPNAYATVLALFNKTISIPYCSENFTMENPQILGQSRGNADNVIPVLRALPHMNISLKGYFQSYKYFVNVQNEMRKEFTLSDRLRDGVYSFFRNVTPVAWQNEPFIRVGIHVRIGGVTSPGRMKKHGTANCTASYFAHAMKYFRARHPRVQFILISDRIKWCKKNIFGKDLIYYSHGYGMDFAILTMTDHVIITVGTFSWWAGWLNMGTTVYNGRHAAPGTYEFVSEANQSWIPPDDEYQKWVPIQ